MRIKHKYGCHNAMADGGPVKKKKPMKPHVPPRVKSPILEDAGDPGGPHTPGAKAKRKKKGKSYADGGKVAKKKGKKKLPPSALGSGLAAKAGEAVKGRQSALDKKIAEAGG